MKALNKSPHYLVRNNHSFCFRVNVPKDLQYLVRKRELRYSLAVALIGSLALAAPAIAAGKGQAAQNQTKTMSQTQTKQQLKSGSGTQTGTMGAKSQAGKTYGPGDSTGIQGVGPKEGTGYGAPANR